MILFVHGTISADPLSLNEYLSGVKEKNINYLVEKYQVDIAQARAKAARVFPDPSISFGYSDNQDKKMQMGKTYEMELSYTLETGGKRGARIRLAQGEAELSKALVEDFFYRLRAEASLAYFNLSKEQLMLDLYAAYYKQVCAIATHDSVRYKSGDIMEVDAKQSIIERQMAQINFLQKETEWKQVQADIESYQGQALGQQVESLEKYVSEPPITFTLAQATQLAEEHRMDIRIALQSRKISEYNLSLAKASRSMDIDLSIGLAHNTIVNNPIAPAPSCNTISAGIGIPLQFSRLNRAEVKAFELERQQQDLAYEATLRQVRKETTQAFLAYESAQKQLTQFKQNILTPAQEILDKKTYSYKRGETSWLDWVSAQHNYQETMEQYYETLYNSMASRIQLQLATGKWDM
jgi:cobalt-zinc-cadmium efflux system outer membrane protein